MYLLISRSISLFTQDEQSCYTLLKVKLYGKNVRKNISLQKKKKPRKTTQLNDETGIKRRFGKSAQTYDKYAEIQNSVAQSLNNLIADIAPTSILEIGCGTGLLSTEIVKKFPTASFTFTDLSANMLEIAEKKLKAQFPDNQNQFHFEVFNPETDKLEDKYDLIISSMAIHWFKDVEKSIQSLQAALNEKGVFYYSTIGQDCFSEWTSTLTNLNYPNGLRIPENLPGIVKSETIKVPYGSAQNFLKNLKLTGAHSPKPGYIPLSPKQLKTAMSKLEEDYQASLSWEIVYGKCR